ncbi:ParB/RepB/Spo0J family partition protein [Roseicella aerolata]|uniref:ParB/RepB/Spo0J family partition protein n=1 Tax=Roseicella aerolata TaxID=2883479 RepID=A0A9X1LDW2_9PROT|nr:ParB/RepB/Spo0J family partition protein [Roseicella aerolata]MCB4825427.1 ParB/RepB/Spo0J family partition protein [Roseicella aerolata]
MGARAKRPSPVLGAAMALIGEASDTLVPKNSRFRHTFEAPVDRIQPDPDQPRKVFTEVEIAALAATMAEQGQLQPILLRRDPDQRGNYVIVAGERRWRAARLNGWPTVLAIEHDGDAEVAALIENLQRVDLTAVEEARGLDRLIKGKGWTQVQAAEVLGKSKGEISATLRILTLPQLVLDGVLTSELDIPRNALVELARIENTTVRDRLIGMARNGGVTIKAIRAAKEAEVPGNTATVGDDPAQSPERHRPPVGQFSFGTLDRLTLKLRAYRDEGRTVSEDERKHLEDLRREIDALLVR